MVAGPSVPHMRPQPHACSIHAPPDLTGRLVLLL